MKMELWTEIRCRPADLWPWLTETERMKQWMKGLVSIEPNEPGPIRAGTTAKLTIKEGGRNSVYDEKILEWDPPRALRIAVTSPKMKSMEMECYHRLEEQLGSTRLLFAYECRTTSVFFKLLGGIMGLFAKMQARSFMKKLKTLVETPGTAAAAAAGAAR